MPELGGPMQLGRRPDCSASMGAPLAWARSPSTSACCSGFSGLGMLSSRARSCAFSICGTRHTSGGRRRCRGKREQQPWPRPASAQTCPGPWSPPHLTLRSMSPTRRCRRRSRLRPYPYLPGRPEVETAVRRVPGTSSGSTRTWRRLRLPPPPPPSHPTSLHPSHDARPPLASGGGPPRGGGSSGGSSSMPTRTAPSPAPPARRSLP